MDKKQTQKLLMLLPIGSIFTLNGTTYKKMDGYYATIGYKENYEGYVKKVQFEKLNITIRANCLTVSLR
jgi:hypothetical protein